MSGMDGINYMIKMIFFAAISYVVLEQVVVGSFYPYAVAAGLPATAMGILQTIVWFIRALPFIFIANGILFNFAYAFKYGSGGQASNY